MDITFDILFWIHMVSLGLGGAAAFGIPIVGSRIGPAAPEVRPTLFHIAEMLSNVGRVAIVLLLITGPWMLWLKFNWTPPSNWFWAKMGFLVLMLIFVVWGGINAKQAMSGNVQAAKRAPMIGILAALSFICVMGAAAFAFQGN